MHKTPSKPCAVCGTTFYKPSSCSKKDWVEKRKFCSPKCKAESQRGKPGPRLGMGGGPGSMGGKLLNCRICGNPTQYRYNKRIDGMVHCGSDECREASRIMKNENIRKTAMERVEAGNPYCPDGGWNYVNQTPEIELEYKDWLEGLGFVYQHLVVTGTQSKHYRLDFAHLEKRIDLEFDGKIHQRPDRMEKDKIRDDYFKGKGWTVIRISNEEAKENPDRVKEKILSAVGVR